MPLDIIRRAKDYSPLAHVSHGKKQLLSGISTGSSTGTFSAFQSQKDQVAYRCVVVIVDGPGLAPEKIKPHYRHHGVRYLTKRLWAW